MSDTPRTDAHLADAVRLTSLYSAHPDFARELERENAKLREQINNLRAASEEDDEIKASLAADNARLREDSELLEWLLAGNVVITKSQMATGLFYKPTRAEVVAARAALAQTAKP